MALVDHLVYAVPDLVAACDDFEHRLGVRPEVGGQHVGLGTWNALLGFDTDGSAPCYLELIAADPTQPEPAGRRPFGIDDDAGPRLVTYAVRPAVGETIDDLVTVMSAHGHDPGPVVPMSRATPAGDLLEWCLTFPSLAEHGWVPFVIDWGSTPNPATTIGNRVGLVAFGGACSDEVGGLLAALGLDGTIVRASSSGATGLGLTARLVAGDAVIEL